MAVVRPALVMAVTLTLAGCGKPVLDDLDVKTGPEHTLVMVRGSDLALAAVIWDAGLPTEREIPGGFLGPFMFSVPPGSALGPHPVALKRGSKRSENRINFEVTAPQPYGPPRIDAVTIVSASFAAASSVNAWLYVQGANVDVGAVVQIDGVDVATVAHKGLRNHLHGIPPQALGYPIYHYVALVAAAGSRSTGSTISLKIRNLDGQTSGAFEYVLPQDHASLDSDGDDIPDASETAGYDADGDGVVDVELPALGAHRHRRDIFLEVDVMASPAIQPVPGTFDAVRAMFAAAPILNPFHESGIHLVIDSSGSVPYTRIIGFDAADAPTLETARFGTLKAAHFDNAKRGRIFHYAIWADEHPLGSSSSGHSDIALTANGDYVGPGDDFFVSLGPFNPRHHTLRSHAETLAHELGHNLGQLHGGSNNKVLYKPNYWSVMSYSWQLRSTRNDTFRKEKITCLPAYYATPGATEPNGTVPPANSVAAIDYSEGMAGPLTEDNNSLFEDKGVCGQPVDWNRDGNTTAGGINADVDLNGTVAGTHTDFANWRALDFRGPRLNGTVTP